MKNPLKLDPSRMMTIRRQLRTEIERRFASLRRELLDFIQKQDSFGLDLTTTIVNTKHILATDAEKIDAFRAWFKGQMATMDATGEKNPLNPFWKKFIHKAYTQGAERAFADVKKVVPTTEKAKTLLAGSKAQFMSQTFGTKEAKDKVDSLAQRVFTGIKGLGDDANKTMSLQLSEGLLHGRSAKQVANILAKTLDISKAKALSIVNTEITRAQAEGQLDALEALGQQKVGIAVEWQCMAGACKLCTAMLGVTVTIADARGMIPRHPNCKCSFQVVGISNLTPMAKLKAAIKKSYKAGGKGSIKMLKTKSGWAIKKKF